MECMSWGGSPVCGRERERDSFAVVLTVVGREREKETTEGGISCDCASVCNECMIAREREREEWQCKGKRQR